MQYCGVIPLKCQYVRYSVCPHMHKETHLHKIWFTYKNIFYYFTDFYNILRAYGLLTEIITSNGSFHRNINWRKRLIVSERRWRRVRKVYKSWCRGGQSNLRRYLMHLEYKYTETYRYSSTEHWIIGLYNLYDNHRAPKFSKILQVVRQLHQ